MADNLRAAERRSRLCSVEPCSSGSHEVTATAKIALQ